MKLPEYFQQVKSMPDDPNGSTAYMTGNDDFQAVALAYPIATENAMPYNDNASIIQSIHDTVSDKQALIEVNYNPNLKDSFLMNLSEMEEFDQYFPNHPLSVARLTVKEIVENN